MATGVQDFCFIVPLEKFVYKRRGYWNLAEPVSKEGLRHHLLAEGWDQTDIKVLLENRGYLKCYGWDRVPNKAEVFKDIDGKLFINTWVKPSLKAEPGPYPRIQAILDWVTTSDPEAQRWLKSWLSVKVKNPEYVPKVAVVLTTEQGGGKGSLAYILRHMLGPENCSTIKRETLENRFNSSWADKLFVLADEILSDEHMKDVSNLLKQLIDGDTIELEGKFKDTRAVKNRICWVFASNSTTTPLLLEASDRRYSVFSRHDPIPEDYARLVASCFMPDNSPEPEFEKEMSGFYHELLNMEVDRYFVSRPFHTEARQSLIDASRSSHDDYCKWVDEQGIDELVEYVVKHVDFHLSSTRSQWDFGEEGVSTQIIYRTYVEHCKRSGTRPLKIQKFGAAIRNHRPTWPFVKKAITVNGKEKRVNAYKVPRSPAPPEQPLTAIAGGKK